MAQLKRAGRHYRAIFDPNSFEREAKIVRMGLMDFYGSQLPATDTGKTWYEHITNDDIISLLNWVFPKDEFDEKLGKSYGVYLEKKPYGQWRFFIRGVFGAGWKDTFIIGVGEDIQLLPKYNRHQFFTSRVYLSKTLYP